MNSKNHASNSKNHVNWPEINRAIEDDERKRIIKDVERMRTMNNLSNSHGVPFQQDMKIPPYHTLVKKWRGVGFAFSRLCSSFSIFVMCLILPVGPLMNVGYCDDVKSKIHEPKANQSTIHELKAEPAGRQVNQAGQPLSYSYNPAGKHDPFKPFIETETSVKVGESQPPSTPLQRYNVQSFKLVGITWSNSKRVAMVKEPSGKTYFLYKGTPIGMNEGRVAEILADRVIVEESLKSPSGKVTKQRVDLRLRAE